jgi:predicted small metal-binding protein
MDMNHFRRVYTNYISTASEDSQEVVTAFIDRVTSENLLTEFADDYIESVKKGISTVSSASKISRDPKPEEGVRNREMFKESMEGVGLYKES